MNTVDEFKGPYAFLSNFFPSPIRLGNSVFPTVEHAYQAAKTMDKPLRKEIATAKTPGKAKRLGQLVPLRPDWEDIKVTVMYKALKAKFKQNKLLGKKLVNTGDKLLFEGNDWGDRFWGVYKGRGKNVLGRLLMDVREEIKSRMKVSAARNGQERVFALLQNGGWYTTVEICAVDVGGSGGCRRLRYLRKEIREGEHPGYKDIKKRKAEKGTQYEYRLIEDK